MCRNSVHVHGAVRVHVHVHVHVHAAVRVLGSWGGAYAWGSRHLPAVLCEIGRGWHIIDGEWPSFRQPALWIHVTK